MSCGVGRRHSSDPELLWLWRSRPVATALIQPLAWELPYASGVALKRRKKKKNEHFKALNISWQTAFQQKGRNYLHIHW